MKVNELQGAALDWAVAQAEGNVRLQYDNQEGLIINNVIGWFHYRPSVAWEQGGPIIEREWLDITPWPNESREDMRWHCQQYDTANDFAQYGPTPLIAAMRCFVASKMGDDVEIPEELI